MLATARVRISRAEYGTVGIAPCASSVDLRDDAEIRWLEALVWPGEEYRLPRLRAACEVARSVSPRVIKGDLRIDLAALAAQAPRHATLVVFHTAVLAYVRDPQDREAFAASAARAGATWIANEGAHDIPAAPRGDPRACRPGGVSAVRRRDPIAWTDGHGTWIDWLSSDAGDTVQYPI